MVAYAPVRHGELIDRQDLIGADPLLAVEESGAVVVAAIGGGLCVVQPDGSGHEYLPIDDRFVTNVCFTGDDMRNAFVTLSGTGRLVAMDWARPGLPLAH